MKKLLSLGILMFILSFAVQARAYSYWTSSTKLGYGFFQYSEQYGAETKGGEYSLKQRFNYHNNLFLLSIKGSLGIVPGTYTGFGQTNGVATTGSVYYSLENFSIGAGIDPRLMGGLMQNELYLSLGDMTHDFMAGNSSFSNGVNGYDESYQVKYLSLTYKNIYAFTPKVSNVFKLEYLDGFNGTATTKGMQGLTIDGYSTNNNLEFNLSGENGYTIAEGARYRLTDNLSLVGDVYYSALFFKHSSKNDVFYEPSSMTHQYGVQIGVHYDF
jgi:hypothetical protein